MTPDQWMDVFDHCIWKVFQAGAAWLGLCVLVDIIFGGKPE